MGNSEKAVPLAGKRCIALGRNHIGMFRTDVEERFAVILTCKTADGIGTTKRKRVGFREMVPKLLEPDRRLAIALRPQERDHFAESGNPATLTARNRRAAFEHVPQVLGK